ncbi:aminotransferase class III-fold pyridoxal phosphate-dependent enzyme [Nakamurella sp. YIM 132087]|uniref:Aminotransferase class III-fold pyridoxal phosphate-dependent enzyme n=1 Tax=Nakamurella alba TaxID=2665158 RepID=A0A7K1FSS7_9ACTN|nr:aminotransferase class III-fold pyridoxal phosphate-dependent enzyme [Nakamurella alba]
MIPHFTTAKAWADPTLPVLTRGEGVWVEDTKGRRYFDGLSGLFCSNLGHGRADLVAAASEQMSRMAFFPTWGAAHDVGLQTAAAITSRAPEGLDAVFFVSSGSEAVESAVKLARTYHLANGEPGRYKVISRDFSYHGTTLGALSVTAVPRFREPYLPMLGDFVRNVPNTLRSSPAPGGGAGDLSGVQAIEDLILAEGPETVSAVFAEPVQNGGGAIVPPEGYWQALRAVCDKYGVLLVADEVITGFGRLGTWFGSEYFGVVPDLITFAKGATSAYVPFGGVLTKSSITGTIAGSELGWFAHGSTFGAHPVASAVSLATMDAMEKEQVLENVNLRKGDLLGGLQRIAQGTPFIREVRGTGFFYAMEIVADRDSGQELSAGQRAGLLGGVLMRAMRSAGVLLRPDDRGPASIVVSPPLVTDGTELDEMLNRTEQVVAIMADWLRENSSL